MPTIIRCKKCGNIMGEWEEMPMGHYPYTVALWYERFYKERNGECGVCGHKLPTPREYSEKMRVQVKPLELVIRGER